MTKIPNGLEEIKALYGNAGMYHTPQAQMIWQHRVLAPVRLPFSMLLIGKPTAIIQVHRKTMTDFLNVFRALGEAGLSEKVQELNGTFSYTAKRSDPNLLSVRAWGIGIELNLSTNSFDGESNQDPRVVAIFKDNGFVHGADFVGIKEPALFQLATGYEG